MSITVVLHEPQDLVNIAHVVRALKNFSFRDLRLVRPREFDAYRIEGIAHQTQDVLARVTRYERLDDALADCVHVVGFTARERSAKRNRQRPREAAAELLAQAEVGTVALLFGREDKGLPNEALDRCHRLVTIPTDPAYASLQLGHAVALMLYELALARRGGPPVQGAAPRGAARPGRGAGAVVRGRGSGVVGDRILQDAPGRSSAAHRAGGRPPHAARRARGEAAAGDGDRGGQVP